MCILPFSLSSYAPFSSTVSCVTNVPFVPFFPFSPPSCPCNRPYVLPHVLSLSPSPLWFPSLSHVPLSCHLLHAPLPTPSPLCMQHALLPCRVGFSCSGGACLLTRPCTHTHCFHICPFARVHNQNLHICRFGDASQNTRHVRLHHLSLTLRLVLSDSQQITAVILSLFPSVSPIEFSNTYNTP